MLRICCILIRCYIEHLQTSLECEKNCKPWQGYLGSSLSRLLTWWLYLLPYPCVRHHLQTPASYNQAHRHDSLPCFCLPSRCWQNSFNWNTNRHHATDLSILSSHMSDGTIWCMSHTELGVCLFFWGSEKAVTGILHKHIVFLSPGLLLKHGSYVSFHPKEWQQLGC